MQINVGPYKRWYDKEPRVSEAFAKLLILPDAHRQLFSDVINHCSIHLKKQGQPTAGLTSLGSDRIIGFMKAQKRRRPEDQDKNFHRAMTNLYVLDDTHRDFMAERVYISINCYDQYILVCNRMALPQDLKEMGQLVTITIGKGLRAGERYLITIGKYDEETQIALSKLTIVYAEPVDPRAEQYTPAVPLAPKPQMMPEAEVEMEPEMDIEPEPPPLKERARLKSSDQGMKIHSQDTIPN